MSVHTHPLPVLIEHVRLMVDGSAPLPAAVCFDFFDTLVTRNVPAEDTKKLAAQKLSEKIDHILNPDEIYQLRAMVEQRLCRENRIAGYDAEFNLLGLAGELHGALCQCGLPEQPGDREDFINYFAAIELAVEKEVEQVDENVAELLKYCRDKKIVTAIISDFYLPGKFFDELVAHHGLLGQVDHTLVSADYLRTKGDSGALYRIAAETIGCVPGQMIMIGDNPHADGVQAAAQGLKAYCLEHRSKASPSTVKCFEPFERAFQKHRAPVFAEMGLTLHWFVCRLFLSALADNCRRLFFCSKEGEYLRKLFIRYQQLKFGRQVIDSHYLYVSRKATFVCSLKPLEQETFVRLFMHYRDLSLSEFLQSLNFSESHAVNLCAQLGLDHTARHADLQSHADFKRLIESSLFKERYEQQRRQQRANFLKYLSHFNVDFAALGLSLVDVGWKGSIQNNIYHALDGRVRVHGYYLGLLSPTEISRNNKKTGILFHDTPVHSDYIHVFNNNRSLFEMLLGATHGSADGYYADEQLKEEIDANVSLIRVDDEPEIPRVALVDLPEERELYVGHIKPLQESFLQLHDDLTRLSTKKTGQSLELTWVARKHARMVFKPKGAEIDLFSRLYHLENFGLFEFTGFAAPERITLVERVRNLWALKSDPAAFLETGTWPPIILRRLGLEFLIPVDGRKRFERIFGSKR